MPNTMTKYSWLVIVLYVAWVIWSAGALYADIISGLPSMYHQGGLYSEKEARLNRRHTAGLSVFISLIPLVGPVAVVFVTGFYASGWMVPGSVPTGAEADKP